MRLSLLFRGYGLAGVMVGLGFVAFTVLTWAHVANRPHHPAHAQATTILLGGTAFGAGFIMLGVLGIQVGVRERRLERARREQPPQPRADSASAPEATTPADLALIFEVEVRPRWRAVLANWLLATGAFLYFTISGMLMIGNTLRQALIVLGVLVILGPFLAAFVANQAGQRVVLTNEGVTIRNGLSPERAPATLRWAEADWFARFRYGQRQGSPECYELGSARGRVRWIRLYPPPRYMPLFLAAATKPTIAFERYEQQMDAIQAFIIAKTQVPLHEL